MMPAEDKKWIIIIITITLFVLLTSSVAADNFIREILSPFEGLDIGNIYYDYAPIIDFIIYIIVFVGIANVVLARRFEGRGGTLVIVGVGLILSLSLAVAEASMGFSLKSFGPVAAFIFIFLVGIILFRFIRHSGLGVSGSAGIAYITMYFSIMAISPDIFDWIGEKMPFVHGVFVLSLIAAFWKSFRIFTRGHTTPRTIGSMINDVSTPIKESEEIVPERELQRDEDFVRHRLKNITKYEWKDGKRIIDDLGEIGRAIIKYGDTPKARSIIEKKLRDLSEREHYMIQKLNQLLELTTKIDRIDRGDLIKLEQKAHRLKGKEKEIARKELKYERAKIRCLDTMQDFEFKAKRYDQNFKYCLSQVVACLKRNNPGLAEHWIKASIKYENEAEDLFKKIKRYEKLVVFLSKKEIKKESK